MSIEISTNGAVQTITVRGPLDAAVALEAKAVFEQVLATTEGDVVLDMGEVDFIDSSGVGAIVFLYKRLVMRQRGLTLTALNGQPLELIVLLRLDRSIPVTRRAA